MHHDLVTILQQRTAELIQRHALPAAYPEGIITIAEKQRTVSLHEGIARGENAILENRVISHQEARRNMARWLA